MVSLRSSSMIVSVDLVKLKLRREVVTKDFTVKIGVIRAKE
jgi:hypothetical protein